MARIKLPDGAIIEANDGITGKQVAEKIGAGLAKAAIAAKVNGNLVDLSAPINGDVSIQIITSKDTEGLEIMRHSCAYYGRGDLPALAQNKACLWADR